VSHGVVFAETADGEAVALDATTGTELWRTGLGGSYDAPDLYATPAVANGVVYFGAANGTVSALDASSGAVLWQAQTGGSTASSPAVVDGTLYIGSGNGTVSAYRLPGAPQPPPRPALARLVGVEG
jgi:outer membrane protein assembly factor BamB